MSDSGYDHTNKLGAGGNQFPGRWGVSVSSNITPTVLSARSDDDIKTIITAAEVKG